MKTRSGLGTMRRGLGAAPRASYARRTSGQDIPGTAAAKTALLANIKTMWESRRAKPVTVPLTITLAISEMNYRSPWF